MKIINLTTYPAILANTTVIAAFTYSSVLNFLWPEVCWTPRVGGLMVGIAVFMQGYVSVNKGKFSADWRWGLTREQAHLHVANCFAILGTGLWAFGDLLPVWPVMPHIACTVPA